MEFGTFLLLYGGAFVAFLFLTLFGDNPAFAGTPIAAASYCVTVGPCDAGSWLVAKLCGARGERAVDSCSAALCERKTPALQLVYLALVGYTYKMYHENVFALLPMPGVPAWHMYTGTGVLALCLAAFLAASVSDPGFVSKANVAHWLRTPYDGVTNKRKLCSTCGLQRPARAKHCNVCGRCVARFDHHCGWVNNCIGARNLRWFLAFLLSNCLLAVYGCALLVLVLRAELAARRALTHRWMDHGGRIRERNMAWSFLAEYAFVHYPTQVIILVQLVVVAVMMGFFSAYHLWLVAAGTTTYETSKWRHVRLEAYDADSPQPWKPAEVQPWWRMQRLLPRLRKRGTAASVPSNIYRRGLWASFREVLLPGRAVEQRDAAAVSRLQLEPSADETKSAAGTATATANNTSRPRTRRSAAAEAGSAGQRH